MADSQKLVRANKKACLANLCETIHNKVLSNDGRMPYRYMPTLIKENQKDSVWLTRDIFNSAYTRYKKKKKKKRRLEGNSEKDQPTILQIRVDKKKVSSFRTSLSDLTNETVCSSSTSNDDTNNGNENSNDTLSVENRDRGGRPIGTTQSQKRKRDEMIVSMKN